MKFAVIGGDRRALWLCRLLSQDGHRVYSYALERLELPEAVPKAGCLEVCVYGADAVLLPAYISTVTVAFDLDGVTL